MNKEILAPGIVLYKECFDNTSKIVSLAKNLDYSQVNLDFRKVGVWGKREDELIYCTEDEREIWNTVNNKLNECLKDYMDIYHYSGIETEGISFLRYSDGEHFDFHLDENFDAPRTTSVTIYLNDNYDGGEMEFEHFNIKIKPSAGDIAMFSSAYPYRHRVTPVSNGIRYAAVAWYRWKTLINFYPQTDTQDRVPYKEIY